MADKIINSDIHIDDRHDGDVWRYINLTAQNDTNLSFKAKGIYNHIATRPPGWKSVQWKYAENSPDFQTSIADGINELIANNYLWRVQIKKGNKIDEIVYIKFYHGIPRDDETIIDYVVNNYPEIPRHCVKVLDHKLKRDYVRTPKVDNSGSSLIFPESEFVVLEPVDQPVAGLRYIENKNKDIYNKNPFNRKSPVEEDFYYNSDDKHRPQINLLNRRTKKFPGKFYLSRIGNPEVIEQNNSSDLKIARCVMEYWNKRKNLTTHKPNGNPYEKAISAIIKKLKNHTKKVLLTAIKSYDELFDVENLSLNKRIPGHKVNCEEFFCGFASNTKERMEANKVELPFAGSWFTFLKNDLNPEMLFAKFIEDEKPEITKQLKIHYIKIILNGISPLSNWSPKQENNFRLAAMKLNLFVKRNMKTIRFTPDEIRRPQNIISHLFTALEESNFKDISPGLIASNFIFDNLLPKYFGRIGSINSNKIKKSTFSI